MRKTFVDFETRSEVALPKRNASIYARDDSTDALCLAFDLPGRKEPGQWKINLHGFARELADDEGLPEFLARAIKEGWELHAHNASFERYVWRYVCARKYGWPDVPLNLWHCTAGKAAHANMPRSLGKLCLRLGMVDGKDADGKRLIRLLSCPQRMTKKRIAEGKTQWEDDAKEHAAFRAYNRQDVIAEKAVDAKLPDWPEAERKVWQLDRLINERGIPADRALCVGALNIHAEIIRRANARIAELTRREDGSGSYATALTQVERLGDWIQSKVDDFPTKVRKAKGKKPAKRVAQMAEANVKEWLAAHPLAVEDPFEDPGVAAVAEALRLRLDSASATVKKYKAALATIDDDDRLRETLLYYASPTGRWGGRGIQPQNFARVQTPPEWAVQAVVSGDYDAAAAVADALPALKNKKGDYPYKKIKTPMDLLKACIRGILKAPDGYRFIVSDFAGIEARVLHWVVGNDRMLQLFRDDQDIYLDSAFSIYDVEPSEIADWNGKKWVVKDSHSQKRTVGKQAQLGLGYGMGAEKFVASCRLQANLTLDKEFAIAVVKKWREDNELVTRFWKQLDKAAVHVVKTKRPVRLGKFILAFHPKNFLTIQLPSGRQLFYYSPRIARNEERGGAPELQYIDGNKKGFGGGKWTKTYGGKLVENVIQAISRDLLVHSMQLINKRYSDHIVLHVHDESVTLIREDDEAAEPFVHKCMQTLPNWAVGLPLAAETHSIKRYSK